MRVASLCLCVALVSSSAAIAVVPKGLTRSQDTRSVLQRFTAAQLGILEKLNRTEMAMLDGVDDLVVPSSWEPDELAYAPLPAWQAEAAPVAKYLLVDLRMQAFGGYERGRLVRWGPISSGARTTPTPSGVFSLTWRALSRVSTLDASWILRWYFNFSNQDGLAFHLYTLPGHPASHGCVRLLERDAQWLYGWGEGWSLAARVPVLDSGTPVHIVGRYDFDAPSPWSLRNQP